ncbi:DUF2306 domain-containing protein [Mesobacterium sp. TK19101]|uniref:DUF2306 domain-containing protein n=1 Tax=Mesobacterium hydrothermale TaxID=3111907 RepID=A0ABU6HFV4_9RHOB|nr:DUF2306 domain-containing protein [Mesobacterium sp. TK19101]MEC3860348.1 DUF2306 domain-containing protein [Mesobacterium sp. TK19101]
MPFLVTSRAVLFWGLSIAVALVSWRFVVLGVPMGMPFMAYRLDGQALTLYAHIGLAPVALIVLPVQFSPRLRKARPGLHRWMGRVYGAAVVVSGLAGLALAMTTRAGPVAAWGFGALAVLWLGATVWAVWLAMAGRIAEHRRWMLRSAALTFAAVTLRLYLPILAAVLGFDTAYAMVAWLAWVPNMLIAEAWLRR